MVKSLKELVDHIFELVQNSYKANSTEIYIGVFEERHRNRMRIVVKDDGKGMPPDMIPKLRDPFFTKRAASKRRVGFGLAFLYQDCEQCGGEVGIDSKVGIGTTVEATWEYDHIDRVPLGDLKRLFKTILCMEDKHVNWVIEHRIDRRGYKRDLRRIKREIDREYFNTSYALKDLDDYLDNLESIFEGIR